MPNKNKKFNIIFNVTPQKVKNGFWSKIGKFFKKTAIAAGLIGTGIAAVALLKGCNKTQASQPVQADSTKIQPTPADTTKTEVDSIPSYTAPIEHIVEEGECYDKIAKKVLIDEYKEA